MAVSFGSANATAEGTRANTVYTAPASIANGDLLIIWHFEFSDGGSGIAPTATPPTGFNELPVSAHTGADATGVWPIVDASAGANRIKAWGWYKIASGESGDYTVTHTTSLTRGIIARVTGNDTSSPFSPDPTQGGDAFGTSSSTTTFLGLTTTVNSQLLLGFAFDDNDAGGNLSAPTNMNFTCTEQVDDNHGNYLWTGTLATAGATGTGTMSNNSTSGVGYFSVLVAVQPPATGSPDLNVYRIN